MKMRALKSSILTRRWSGFYFAEVLEPRTLLSQGALTQMDSTGVSGKLLQLAASSAPMVSDGTPVDDPTSFLFDKQGRVAVEITAIDVNALAHPLADRGFVAGASFPEQHLVEGYLPLSAIGNINELSAQGLLGVLPVYKPMTATGNVNSQGDHIMEAQRARAATGVTGAGVTVGVLSDSYNNLGTASNDVTSGDLPNNVNVLQDLPMNGTDEGRAMLQIVHDLAPGSDLAFATASAGEAQFAQNIRNLAMPVAQGGAGAQVITDDVFYFDEPMFQDGIVTQAIDDVVAGGASYFALAGNLDTQAYESTNVNFFADTIPSISALPGNYYNFNPGGTAADKQTVTLKPGQAVILSLEWNQPYYTASGVTSSLNLYFLDHNTGTFITSSTNNALLNQTPNQISGVINNGSSNATVDVVISLAAGTTPTRIKYVNYGANNYGDAAFTFATNSPTVIPHSTSPNALSVGASRFYDQRNHEPFSSAGPATILFAADGTALGSAQVRAKPDILATDGIDTTFFGSDIDGNGLKNFFGTSCAAPHAAAIGALIKSANPGFTATQIYTAMKNSADPNIGGTPGNVNFIGAGLVDAYRALVGTPTAASLNINDGFESGFLNQQWETYTSVAGHINVVNGLSPASGNFQLIEDADLVAPAGQVFSTVSNLEEAILHVNLQGATNVMLSFAKKSFFDGSVLESTDAMPGNFTGHGNFDGVAISVNGINWFLVQNLSADTNSNYNTYNLNLSTIAANAGITLSADTRIKFQHYDAHSSGAPDLGFGFDNINVTGIVGAGGSIVGQLFQDNNGNGALDGGEPTLNNVSVYLDTNNNGSLDGGETSVTTSGSGNYSFASLTAGTYHLRQVVPSGYIQSSSPSDPVVSTSPITADLGDFPVSFPIAPAAGGGNDSYTVSLDAPGTTEQISDGTTTYTIAKSALATSGLTFNGNAGDDTLTVNFTNGNPVPSSGITYAGGTNTSGDSLAIIGNAGPDTVTFNASNVSFLGSTLSHSGIENFSFNGQGGGDDVTINSGTVTFPATQVFSALQLANGTKGVLTSGANKVLVTTNLSIGPSATLDLTDNDAIVKGGILSSIQTLVGNGYNGGAWTGAGGISSSTAASVATNSGNIHKTALGFALGSATPLVPSFDGQVLNNNDVVIRYTDSGDANLDGTVSTLDFMRLATNFGSSGATWSQAEFTFNGSVNALDFNNIATNFGQVLAAPTPGSLFSDTQIMDSPGVAVYKPSLWEAAGDALGTKENAPLPETAL